MKKLLELEKKLKEAKEELEKFGSQGAPLSSGGLGASIAAGINGVRKEETCKADSTNKYGAQQEAKRINTVNEARQPATVISGGQTKVVSPESQVKAKKDFAANQKAKAETAAKARRDAMRQEGVLKGDDLEKSLDERLDGVLETLDKAMYFGGESTKTSTHGEARNSKGGDKNFPHYDYDSSSSDKENYDAAQKHFEDHKHTYAAHPAGLKQYLVGRKKMAEEGR